MISKMKMGYGSWVMVITILMVMQVNIGMAKDCDPRRLVPCLGFIMGNTSPPPDSECCNSLHAQNECLCSYVKNPAYATILRLPGAKKEELFEIYGKTLDVFE
ncbi:hypothetical protein E3N88_07826 [Mikania micrantha]|uniref:Bifunctional inhibitor/plant lipid transfer protein/seed storage helical domain-containing protein n=1 Tax=Mikania micrantha TaxID=192012 RepID=A0A5N6PGH9_9ASTR|nr:hypothetical protein E3N88_07826 [Mikania micrantha]